jgi:Family of unknown function (DUF6714)
MHLVDEANRLFSSVPRPTSFTDRDHCQECAEHDDTLRNATPESLSFQQVAPGWDPFCFISIDGFRYYFPAMVRLAIEGNGESYFVDQFLFHLVLDGPRNDRYESFSTQQRAFVVNVMKYLLETQAEEIENNLDTDRLFQALEIWDRDSDA